MQKAILGQVSALSNVGTRYFIVPVCAVLLLLWRYGAGLATPDAAGALAVDPLG